MHTIKVQWHANHHQWRVSLATGDTMTFEHWASTQADLTSVRMILAAANYTTHWVALPGVSPRQYAKVLPFALEELLIEDLHQYWIVPAGQQQKRARAYVVAKALLENLLETCQLHHVRVYELIPESFLLQDEAQCVRQEQGWLLSWPGIFEGYVADSMLNPVLESLLTEEQRLENLHLKATALDTINLLKTLLETAFPEQIGTIHSQVLTPSETFELPKKALNLLSGQFQQHAPKEQKPSAWWKPVAGLAAAWLVLWTASLYSEVQQLSTQAQGVRAQSLALYQQLFPGERIRMLERQFQEKLAGEPSSSGEGFLSTTLMLAQVYAQQADSKIELLSMRYNERMKETTIELKSASLSELQALRQALENAGISAEIASATNDKDGVKGRLRITG